MAKADYDLVRRLLRYSNYCRNPQRIAESIGIEVVRYDLKNLKGMYSAADKHRTVYLNSRLKGYLLWFVLAHEIDHDQKHRDKAKVRPFKEYVFSFGKERDPETEANIIAAHILIDEEELREYIKLEYTVEALAKELCVPEDLVLLKIDQMRRMGYYDFKIRELPRRARGNYLLDYDDNGVDFFCE